MPVDVYHWPPVGAVGVEWDYVAPIAQSFSALTGKRYASAAQPVRRVAQINVSAQSADRMGAGYVVMLKRLLSGGANLVRVRSYPLNRFLDVDQQNSWRQSIPVDWTDGAVAVEWTTPPTELLWYKGTILTGTLTTSGGFPAITVTGLPPSRLVARPGEYVTVYQDEDDTVGSTAQVVAPAYSSGGGAATIRLFSALAYGGRVNIGSRDTAVFRVVDQLPRAVQPVRGDWSYNFNMIEVFSDEVGGFTEVPNWWAATGPVPS